MNTLQDTIRRFGRRDLAQRLIRRGGIGLCGGLLGSIGLLLVDRSLGLGMGVLAYAAVVATGLSIGALAALARRPAPVDLALRLDRTFDLKDRLASAASLTPHGSGERGPRHDPAFATLVRREADRLAGGLDVSAAAPLHLSRVWGGAAALAALLLAGGWFLPETPWARPPGTSPLPPGVAPSLEVRRAEAAESIEQAVEEIVPELEMDPELLAEAADEVDALRALARQLAEAEAAGDDGVDPDAARDESALRLNELADRLANQADHDAAAADELARRFAGMETVDDDELPLSMEDFLESLKRGEFGDAGDVLEQMLADAESLGPEERRALSEALRRTSRDVAATTETPPPGEEAETEPLRELLREQGLDDTAIDELLGKAETPADDDRALDDALAQRRIDEEIASEIARDLGERREQERIGETVDRDAAEIADALDEAADAIEAPPRPAEETPQESPEESPGESPPETRDEAREERADPAAPRTPPPNTPQPQEGAPETPSGEQEAPARAAEPPPNAGERPPTEGVAEQRRETRDAEGNEQRTEEGAQAATEEASQPDSQEATEPSEPSARPAPEPPEPGAQPTPSETGAPQEGERRETPAPEPDATPRKRGPGETLREIEHRRQAAAQKRRAAERVRETARRLAERMTPEERERWADQWQRRLASGSPGAEAGLDPEGPGEAMPAEPDDVRLDGDDPASTLLAEWRGKNLPDDPAERVMTDGTADDVARRLRGARRAAERAVEEAAVPARYHEFIKRYFEKLDRAAKPPSAPPAGEDAAAPKPRASGGDDS